MASHHVCSRVTSDTRATIYYPCPEEYDTGSDKLRYSSMQLLYAFYFRFCIFFFFFRRTKFVVSWYMKYPHVWRQKYTKCSAQCSWLSQFDCCQWCSLSCTREDSSLLAITLSLYLVPRVFRIHVIPSLKRLYVLYRSTQSNSSAGNSVSTARDWRASRLDHVREFCALKLTITPAFKLCVWKTQGC